MVEGRYTEVVHKAFDVAALANHIHTTLYGNRPYLHDLAPTLHCRMPTAHKMPPGRASLLRDTHLLAGCRAVSGGLFSGPCCHPPLPVHHFQGLLCNFQLLIGGDDQNLHDINQ